MDKMQLKELLRRKGAGKLDNFLKIGSKKKEKETDMLNLLQTWLHSLLYHSRIYPDSAFQERQVLGVTVFVASSPPLKEYLDCFFQKLRPHLSQVNHLRVIFFSGNNFIQANTMHIDDYLTQKDFQEENEENLGELQKEIQTKTFLSKLQQELKKRSHSLNEGSLTFKLCIGYRYQKNSKQSRQLLDGWQLKSGEVPQGRILCSLKSPTLNLIYQILD